MLKRFKKLVSVLGVGFILVSLVPSVDAGAVDLSTAVSPSKIVDQQVDYGQSKTYKINAANKSSDLPDMTLKNKISIEVGMEDEYGDQIDCSKFVTIDKTEFNLAPENEDFVNLTISPTNPEELPEGNYKVYVDFVQQPIEGLPMSNQTNVIRVPLLVFIGNENDYNSRSCDFRIANVDFDLSGKKTTIINEIFDGCKKVLNPFKIVKTVKEVKDTPSYLFKTKKGLVADINNQIGSLTNLRNVMSNSESSLTNSKYVYCKDEWLNESVKRASKVDEGIEIVVGEDDKISIPCSSDSCSTIFNQIQNIARTNKNCTLSELSNDLQVPNVKGVSKEYPTLVIDLENCGEVAVTAKGNYTLTYNDSEEISNNNIVTPTVAPNSTEEVKDVVTNKSLSSGNYQINGKLVFREISKDFNFNFKVDSLRIWVIIGIIVFFILYIAIILAIIIYILRKLFSKTPKIVDENGHKLNAELVSATLGKYHVYRKKKALSKLDYTLVSPNDEDFKFILKQRGKSLKVESVKISVQSEDSSEVEVSNSNELKLTDDLLGKTVKVSFKVDAYSNAVFVLRFKKDGRVKTGR